MVLNDLRGYLQLANGLTEVTRQRALAAARQLIDQGGGDAGHVARQVQSIAEDLLATSRTNRDLLVGLVRSEVDRTVARLGLVSADELAAMAKLVERLQAQVNAGQPAEKAPAKKVPVKKVPAKKVPAKKMAVKKSVGGKA